MMPKNLVKGLLGKLPYTAEAYWLFRNREKEAFSRFNLDALKKHLPQMMADVVSQAEIAQTGKKIFLFVYLHFWISHAAAIGLTLRGLGHDVTLGYLPYGDFAKPINQFDARRQNLYAREVLQSASSLLSSTSFLDIEPAHDIPKQLSEAVDRVTIFDTQYILQREDITPDEPVYHFRHKRNLDAAFKALPFLQKNRPDVVVVANGMIQEFGVVYETARYLDIPVVTYEFGEQDQHIWLCQNQPVLYFNNTDDLWATRHARKLNKEQHTWLESFLTARQGLSTSDKFAHLWQKTDREGGAKIRTALGLDNRPVVLLPTNVLGDSATLGRTIFSQSMAEWIERVVLFFVNRTEVQLVVRIHPAETWAVGPSVADTIRKAIPGLPPHIHLIGPKEKINTYDLMELTDLALVYTTHAGLEMATRGIPVLVSGKAHYRKKGFTLDADTWDEYFTVLSQALNSIPARLTPEQLELAWSYAYAFFAEYPRPFPWHLEKIWHSMEKRSLAYVLSPEGQNEYGATFQYMVGKPMNWIDL